jgi:serine/threonine-protein phosphatase 2A regulatory subunit B
MRSNALCNAHCKLFDEQEPPGTRSFFSEIIASISDVKFSRNGRYILSRDYLTLKLWDINMEAKPVATFRVHEHLRSKLCDLYESDSIFDKFQCCLSADGEHLTSGSYGNQFRTFDTATGGADTLEVTKNPQRLRQARVDAAGGVGRVGSGGAAVSSQAAGIRGRGRGGSDAERAGGVGFGPVGPGSSDFATKILHMAWHPQVSDSAARDSENLKPRHSET